ncbi:CHY zinc finger protein [Kocuria sp. NPDC057446]|uniref:CHY zinc finger protein n=1 Tax=Kocuria sp. NPDC057446 TaxID=3346137 RepID=UPI0036C11200
MERVLGRPVDEQTRCVHYRTALDVIAIKFRCCREYYPCHLCHQETAGHPAAQWPVEEYDTEAVLCGVCGHELSVREYLAVEGCPRCAARFNPGCALHADLYFEPAFPDRDGPV